MTEGTEVLVPRRRRRRRRTAQPEQEGLGGEEGVKKKKNNQRTTFPNKQPLLINKKRIDSYKWAKDRNHQFTGKKKKKTKQMALNHKKRRN